MKMYVMMLLLSSALVGLLGPEKADAWWPKKLVVVLEGENVEGSIQLVPDIDGDGNDDFAECFTGDLVSPRFGWVVGTGTECLAPDASGRLIATTTFSFWRGSFTSRGKMNLQPIQWSPADNDDVDPSVGVITGYFPAPGTNNIIGGTGRFRNVSGRVRLSGAALPLGPHPEDPEGPNFANLNCIFIIEFDR